MWKKSLLVLLVFLCVVLPVKAERCSLLPPRVETLKIPSEELGKELVFNVYLPACMDERTIPGYPVLYLLHGHDMGMEIWEEIGLPEAMMDAELPLFIVVTPQEEDNLIALSLSGFEDAILDELIPYIDARYHTCTTRNCRALGGISRGALWAEKLFLDAPELFGTVGLQSMPGTVYDDSGVYYALQSCPQTRVRIDIGTEDGYRNEASAAAQQLINAGYNFEWVSVPGGHDAAYWQRRLPESLKWYSAEWKTLTLPEP